jgi:hypothetical protein
MSRSVMFASHDGPRKRRFENLHLSCILCHHRFIGMMFHVLKYRLGSRAACLVPPLLRLYFTRIAHVRVTDH